MGFTISVNNFVHVMAEENKRLVAYVEDMYEDSRVNRMVVVRWFHKVDEVGIVLPPDVNDREIFFSLCLQDFSVECIDGLAVVLNPQHFDKFLNEAKHVHWELPYMCRRQIDNDDVKAFDITQVQGYWKQEIIRRLLTGSMRIRLKLPRTSAGSKSVREQTDEPLKTNMHEGENVLKSRVAFVEDEKRISNNRVITQLPRIDEGLNQSTINWLSTGSHVEVLSQDSGIRGCWFTGIVLKKFQDKVKVRYDDLQDAEETGCLEEWILASRVAAPDQLGVHLCGRTVVRPCLLNKCTVELRFDVGEMVDARWCDGWWEGIVLRREAEGKVHVYFPGEKQNLVFSQVDLRHSQDWLGNKWHAIKGRPDLVHLLLGDGESEIDIKSNEDVCHIGQPSVLPKQPIKIHVECPPSRALNTTTKGSSPKHDCPNDGEKENEVLNLVKDSSLSSLKWSLSKKRRRSGRDRQAGLSKRQRDGTSSSSSSGEDGEPQSSPSRKQQFLFTDPVKLEHDNCSKFGGNHSHFGAPVPLSSLVMSR
ncbi:hypothetical protein QJS10_CPA06g02197 [Acorus calamus]|uniref:BAH domain-containing protein n=1 Tax=Acorus calamus TaxID=4465 RepID=A0AAV9EJ35_ACOCL|nr:hypothetical protein QJS10_CPA06g02197 [Acorus calamus]